MRNRDNKPSQGASAFPRFTTVILILLLLLSSSLGGYGPSTEELVAVDCTSLPGDEWRVSAPAEPRTDPRLSSPMPKHATLQDPIANYSQSGRIKAN